MSTREQQHLGVQIRDHRQSTHTDSESGRFPYRGGLEYSNQFFGKEFTDSSQEQSSWFNRDGQYGPELWSSQKRKRQAETDYNHHGARSSAETYFSLSDVSNDSRSLFRRLKSWNDGARDKDRQEREGQKDKLRWADAQGHRVELPSPVIGQAKAMLRQLDVRTLGAYNNVHIAVLAALTESYGRWWLYQRYRRTDSGERWRERDDFNRLCQNIGLRQEELNNAAKLVSRRTSVSSWG